MQKSIDNEMKKEIEIEYKALLTESKYEELISYFSRFTNVMIPYSQTNYYFDTDDYLLANQGITVRLRNIEDSWKFQIKIPKETDGMYNIQEEIALEISSVLAGDFISKGIDIYNQLLSSITVLREFDIERLNMIGKLQTLRHDFNFYTDTISVDRSTYLDTIDYELEWETNNHKFVLYEFEKLGLIPTVNVGKITRFLDKLK